jgi:hypothetical protein
MPISSKVVFPVCTLICSAVFNEGASEPPIRVEVDPPVQAPQGGLDDPAWLSSSRPMWPCWRSIAGREAIQLDIEGPGRDIAGRRPNQSATEVPCRVVDGLYDTEDRRDCVKWSSRLYGMSLNGPPLADMVSVTEVSGREISVRRPNQPAMELPW